MTRLTAGVDLGGTKIQTVILRGHEVTGSARIPTPQAGADAVIAARRATVLASLEAAHAQTDDRTAAGIGRPRTVDAQAGSRSHSPSAHGREPEPLPPR